MRGNKLTGDDILNRLKAPSFGASLQAYMHSAIVRQFDDARLGGTARGVRWRYFQEYYVRKDGTAVDPFGTTPKVRGKGYVKARLRSKRRGAKKRLQRGDAIMQDSGAMLNQVAADMKIRKMHNRDGVRVKLLSKRSIKYMEMQDEMRKFLFFSAEDRRILGEMGLRQLIKGDA